MIIGDCWGHTDAFNKRAFSGTAGMELDKMLAECGIRRDDCYVTVLYPHIGPMWKNFIVEKGSTHQQVHGLRPKMEMLLALNAIYAKIFELKPKLIIACGNYPLWALTDCARIGEDKDNTDGQLVPKGINDFRGSMLWYKPRVATAEGLDPIPVLPIIDPSDIMRSWELRNPTLHDLRTRIPKALRNDWSPKFPPTIRHMPTFAEATVFLSSKLVRMDAGETVKLANDIETRNYIITCMGFADSAVNAIVIPFIRKDGEYFASYWTVKEETILTRLISRVLSHPKAFIIGQFYNYDSTYIHRYYGIIPNLRHDTLGAQHLLWPGTPKDLGYLSSLFCSYHRYWKDDNKEWDAKTTLDSHFLYNGEDCIRTYEIHLCQLQLIAHTGNEHRWTRTMERHRMAFEMSIDGILMDMKRKAELSFDLAYEAQIRIARLLKIAPQTIVDELNGGPTFRKKPGQSKAQVFWPHSTSQQKLLFYDLMGMAGQKHRKTKQPTLDKEAIPKLKARYPWASIIFDILLELRSIDVFASTFVNARVDADHRMRTSFNAAGTETFRWSSSKNPFDTGGNFQNLPQGKEI